MSTQLLICADYYERWAGGRCAGAVRLPQPGLPAVLVHPQRPALPLQHQAVRQHLPPGTVSVKCGRKPLDHVLLPVILHNCWIRTHWSWTPRPRQAPAARPGAGQATPPNAPVPPLSPPGTTRARPSLDTSVKCIHLVRQVSTRPKLI